MNVLLIAPEFPETFWTLLRRPLLFPRAVTLAIYGFHFRQVYKQQLR